MRRLKERISVYWPFAQSELQRQLAYRSSFFFFLVAGILEIFVIYYLWRGIYESGTTSQLEGFSFPEMITYLFISTIVFGMVTGETDRIMGMDVVDGSIAMNLIKPINYRTRLLFMEFGGIISGIVMVVLPVFSVLIFVQLKLGGKILPAPSQGLLFLGSFIFSFIIMFLFNFCFGMIAFYTTYIWGLRMSKYATLAFFSGQIIPLNFFPEWLQKGMQLFPFGSITYTPVMIYMNKFNGMVAYQAMLIQLVWMIVLFLLSNWIWKKATYRLTILGG